MVAPRKTSNKRSRNAIETAERTLEQCLQGENVDKLLTNLSESEREFLDAMAKEIREGGKSSQLEELWRYDYTRKPPTMQEFVDDPYWLGQVTVPSEENPGLWPTWRKILISDFDLDSRLHNVVITGSLGIGKTWNMTLIMLYRLTLGSLLRNPTNFVGLAVGSRLVYVLMSVTRAQVQDTAFGEAMNYMGRSPYFLEELHFDPDCRYSGQVIDLGRGIQLSAGSKGQHILGRNTLGVGMDEGNFRLEANPDTKAYKLYHEVRTRIKNRFQKVAGFLPAISIIASSAKDESAFTEQVISEIVKRDDPSTEKVYCNSIYRMKDRKVWLDLGADDDIAERHANDYTGNWFKVSYGLKNVVPQILTGAYDRAGNPVGDAKHEQLPTGSKYELVPWTYMAEYDRDIVGALQSLSGISIGGSYRLFTSLIDVEWCITEGEKLGVANPATVDFLPISEENDREIWDFLDHTKFLQRSGSRIIPKRHPNAMRFAHMDLATRSMAGIGVCHMVGWKEIQDAVEKTTGSVFAEQRLIVEYDFILTVVAGKTKPISFEKIQKFFIWLREKCGYQWGLITADTYQSFMQLQMLETRGFPTGSLSLDRSKSPYYAWRSGWEERRILSYRQPMMVREMEKLIDGPKMVDHPVSGGGDTNSVSSKDTCLAGDTLCCDLSGQVRQIKDIPAGEALWVYTIKDGMVTSASATSLGMTRSMADLVKLKLDNGESLKCTPDHKIMLPNGSYCRADELITGQKVMPAHKIISVFPACAEPVYCLSVPETRNFGLECGLFVHNCDGAAGAYYNCIINPQTPVDSLNNPALIPGSVVDNQEAEKAPISIEIPPWRRSSRTFISRSQ